MVILDQVTVSLLQLYLILQPILRLIIFLVAMCWMTIYLTQVLIKRPQSFYTVAERMNSIIRLVVIHSPWRLIELTNTHLTENDGVQGNGAVGPSGVVTFTIPMQTDYDTVDYYCTAHPTTMFGTFQIMDYPGDGSDQGGNSTDSMFTGVSANWHQGQHFAVEFDIFAERR